MFVNKNWSFKGVMGFTGMHLIWIFLWVGGVACLYKFTGWSWLSIPWLPLSVIGTAVAFYVGFKNNQSYDRLWEARKIWGGIVNSSRSWGAMVKSFITNQHTSKDFSEEELFAWKKKLIYRHIAYLYVLRYQLLKPTPWEHISQGKHMRRHAEKIKNRFGAGLVGDGEVNKIVRELVTEEEYTDLGQYKNIATQIIDRQSMALKELRDDSMIDDFRHMELQKLLTEFYTLQGKCERIKKFPLPRQYGGASIIFVGIFIFLLPFGMVSEFAKLGEWGIWVSIPFTAIVAWVYLVMELVGDYSENPFEGLGNDIPMLSLCRTIEIDLREMLGETDLPPAVEAKNGVLI